MTPAAQLPLFDAAPTVAPPVSTPDPFDADGAGERLRALHAWFSHCSPSGVEFRSAVCAAAPWQEYRDADLAMKRWHKRNPRAGGEAMWRAFPWGMYVFRVERRDVPLCIPSTYATCVREVAEESARALAYLSGADPVAVVRYVLGGAP